MKIAVVGATGLVGTKMLQVLAERNFPVSELIPVASEKSIGKEIKVYFSPNLTSILSVNIEKIVTEYLIEAKTKPNKTVSKCINFKY